MMRARKNPDQFSSIDILARLQREQSTNATPSNRYLRAIVRLTLSAARPTLRCFVLSTFYYLLATDFGAPAGIRTPNQQIMSLLL